MAEAHRYPMFNGQFDRYLRVQFLNWAARQHAPEDGCFNLLQQIYAIFFCNGRDKAAKQNRCDCFKEDYDE
jgi:hypothetical protein